VKISLQSSKTELGVKNQYGCIHRSRILPVVRKNILLGVKKAKISLHQKRNSDPKKSKINIRVKKIKTSRPFKNAL
jgi:hypothetical protein